MPKISKNMCTTSQEVKCILIQVPFVQIILHMKTNDDDYKHWQDSVDSFYSILHLSHEYYCKQKFSILKKEFIG